MGIASLHPSWRTAFRRAARGPPRTATLTPPKIVIKYNYSGQEVIYAQGKAPPSAAGQTGEPKVNRPGTGPAAGLNRTAKRKALNDGHILAVQDRFSNPPDGVG